MTKVEQKIKYKTVFNRYIDSLDKAVNKLLNSGWELYGNPYRSDAHICQALIKKGE